MRPTPTPLRLYGQSSGLDPLPWASVDERLANAGTYWVVPRSAGQPHPRPVWGIWRADALRLSIGSRVLARALDADPVVTVHLDSGTDVVVLDGRVTGSDVKTETIAAYDAKYDWSYDVDQLGPLTVVSPSTVLAWRSAGWAGRESFRCGGRWTFDGDSDSDPDRDREGGGNGNGYKVS